MLNDKDLNNLLFMYLFLNTTIHIQNIQYLLVILLDALCLQS